MPVGFRAQQRRVPAWAPELVETRDRDQGAHKAARERQEPADLFLGSGESRPHAVVKETGQARHADQEWRRHDGLLEDLGKRDHFLSSQKEERGCYYDD